MKTFQLIRDIQIEEEYDLVVAGGGPAGSAAAICAGRLGLKVLLVEATGCLGGMSTSGLVTAFNPLTDGEQMLARGFMRELVEMMYTRGFIPSYITPDEWRKKFHCWTPFNPEGLKLVLDEMARDAGVAVRFFTKVIDAEADVSDGRINGIIVHNIEGYRYLRAGTFIDATGDAVLADLSGVQCREGGKDTPRIMPSTLCSIFAGIDWANVEMGGINGIVNPALEQEAVKKAINDGHFTQPDRHHSGMSRTGDTTGFLNAGHVFDLNSLRCKSLSDGMMLGRRLAQEYLSFYRKYVPGFEDMEHVATASLMGVRESRRIVGEYELTYDDYCARRQFPDQIGVYNNFVDIHPYDCSKQEKERFDEQAWNKTNSLGQGECFGLPYGILVPKGWKNLWVAGRCNSSDLKIHGAIRVQPAAYIMGQAAGTAAAQSVQTAKPAGDLDTEQLVNTLRAADAYLPQEALSKKMTRL